MVFILWLLYNEWSDHRLSPIHKHDSGFGIANEKMFNNLGVGQIIGIV